LAGLGVLLMWFSFYTVRMLHPVWMEAVDYSHGYLILALTGWLLLADLRREPLAPLVPSWLGLVCLFALVLVTLAGLASTTLTVTALAWPALLMATLWAACGPKNARRFALRLTYLYVAMPVWTLLLEPLRRLTVLVVTSWIRVADLPAYFEGNFIHVPSGTFEVQGGCAGLRYAIIAVALRVSRTCSIADLGARVR
jgi:exosortase